MITTAKRIQPRFVVREVKKKEEWKIVWVFPDGSEKDAEEGHIYTQRQNAYRRCKQLNETNNPPYTIYVRIQAEREHCRDIILRKLHEMAPKHGIMVIDPLYETPEMNNIRFVHFGLLVRWKEEDRDPAAKTFHKPPPLEKDFLAWLETVQVYPGVLQLEISRQPFPYSN